MPTQEEIMQKVLAEGGDLADAAALLAAQSPAGDGEFRQDAGATAPLSAAQVAAAAESPTEDWRQSIPAEYHGVVEQVRRQWESGATPKFQKAAEWDALSRSFETNPKGTFLYLREKYGVDLTGDEPRRPAQPPPVQADDGYPARIEAIRDRMRKASNVDEYTAAVDELTDVKAERLERARVQPMQQALVLQAEAQEIAELERDPDVRQLGINVRQLYPQIKKYQQAVQTNPYVRVREALHVVTGEQMTRELAKLRTAAARPKMTAQDRAAGTVAGGGAAAPQGVSFDPTKINSPEMEKALLAAGFRRE